MGIHPSGGKYLKDITGHLSAPNRANKEWRRENLAAVRKRRLAKEDLDALAGILDSLTEEEWAALDEMGKKMHGGGSYSAKDQRRIRWMQKKGRR